MVETAKGNKNKKRAWWGRRGVSCIHLACTMPDAPPVFAACIQSPATCWFCGSCVTLSLHSNSAPGKQRHRGVNISVRLMHHLLKDFHRLHCWWLQPQDSTISLFRAENAPSNQMHQNKARVTLCFSTLTREPFTVSFSLAYAHYRVLSLPL